MTDKPKPTGKQPEKTIAKHMGWSIVQRSNSPSLMITGWHVGKRYKESVKSHLLQAARALIEKRVKELAVRGKLTGRDTERALYGDMERLLLDDIKANGRPSYLESATHRCKHLKRWFGNERAADIDYSKLAAFKTARLKAKASESTVRQELVLMGRMLRLAVMAGRLEHVPPIPTVKVDAARQGFATPEEIGRVVSHLPEHVVGVVQMLYWTGMRSAEALNLQWSSVDLAAQEIVLKAADTKTKRARVIPFGSLRPLAELLQSQRDRVSTLEREEHRIITAVFPGCSPATFKRHWLRAVKAAALPALRPHDLRRSAARNFIRSGVSEGVTMSLLGHRTRSMLDRYNITSRHDLQEGMGRLDRFLAAPQAAPQLKGGR